MMARPLSLPVEVAMIRKPSIRSRMTLLARQEDFIMTEKQRRRVENVVLVNEQDEMIGIGEKHEGDTIKGCGNTLRAVYPSSWQKSEGLKPEGGGTPPWGSVPKWRPVRHLPPGRRCGIG
jgi:hypothetical protein